MPMAPLVERMKRNQGVRLAGEKQGGEEKLGCIEERTWADFLRIRRRWAGVCGCLQSQEQLDAGPSLGLAGFNQIAQSLVGTVSELASASSLRFSTCLS